MSFIKVINICVNIYAIHRVSSWWSYLPSFLLVHTILDLLDSSSYSIISWKRRNCQILNIQRSTAELCEPKWLYPATLCSVEKPL